MSLTADHTPTREEVARARAQRVADRDRDRAHTRLLTVYCPLAAVVLLLLSVLYGAYVA